MGGLSSPTRPTLYFIGVDTRRSSIVRVFPRWATHLGLAENKSENRDVEIDRADAEHSPRFGGQKALHALQDFRRVILLPLPVERKLRIQMNREHLTGDAKAFFEDRAQVPQ